jgi:hypothetical protein
VDRLYLVRNLQSTILDIDGKIRAEQSAQAAVDAVGAGGKFRGVIALGIRALGHDKHALGTEFDTEAASFAPFLDDLNDAMGHPDAVSI